jgi:hypothetical protein
MNLFESYKNNGLLSADPAAVADLRKRYKGRRINWNLAAKQEGERLEKLQLELKAKLDSAQRINDDMIRAGQRRGYSSEYWRAAKKRRVAARKCDDLINEIRDTQAWLDLAKEKLATSPCLQQQGVLR